MSRCGLLRTCVASLIAIAHIGCTRLQHAKGPIGTVSKKLLSFSNFPPSKHGVLPGRLRRRKWLSAALTFADECIFQSERVAEAAFPQSARLFDTIHRLADGLPAVFEDTLDRFPAASFLDPFSVSSKIGWLNAVISAALSHYWSCGNSSRAMNEKEISVDMGWCKNKKSGEEDAAFPALQSTKRAKHPQGTESLQGAGLSDEDANNNTNNALSCKNDVLLQVGGEPAAKCTYKDVLTKGVKEEDTEEDHLLQMKKKHHFYEEEEQDNNGGVVSNGKSPYSNGNGRGKGEKDQILKLFDSSWSVC